MTISSFQEIGPVVYSGKKGEGGIADKVESEEMLNGLILYIGTCESSNGY
ncbi:hypothetical protein [Bacillus cereus]|nr:hypothetical protein [Bacillus cereus]